HSILFPLNAPSTPEIYTLSLHDALPISEFLNIERHVPDTLRCINKSDCAGGARFLAEIDHRIDRSEGVRNVSESKDFHFGRKQRDRKSTRLNSSHVAISYAVFCLKKNNT